MVPFARLCSRHNLQLRSMMRRLASHGVADTRMRQQHGQVGEEKLVELLAAGTEFASLDFKRELDLRNKVKKMDFIEDCAAIVNLPRSRCVEREHEVLGRAYEDRELPFQGVADEGVDNLTTAFRRHARDH